MQSLLEWHDVVFYAPLLMGVCLVLGSAIGLVQTDFDFDADGDVDADAEADTHYSTPHTTGSAVEALPAGKVPLVLTLMTGSLLFGSLGLSIRYLLEGLLGHELAALLALGSALVLATALTRSLTRFVARVMPSTETYATREHELIGQIGIAELDIDGRFGVANVSAPDGSLMKIRCRAERRIEKGSAILVTDYELGRATYTVTESPEF